MNTRELLLKLLPGSPDVGLLRDPATWSIVRQHAPAHGVGPLIASMARPHTSGANRRWCDEQLTRSWDKHLRNLNDLGSAIEVLDRERIQAIPLKGSLLALRHYDPPFLRKPPLDIDLAIRSADLRQTCKALGEIGYASESSVTEARRSSHHLRLRHPSRMPIEIHFRLSHGPLGIPIEELFSRTESCRLPGGQPSWKLDSPDELLHLALHLSSHRFESLFHLYELRRLWLAAPLEAREEAVSRAVGHGFAGAIALTDIGFRMHWKEPFLPPGTTLPRTWLHWSLNEKLYASCENWLSPGRRLGARLSGRLLDLQMTDRPRDAARWLALMLHLTWVRLKRGEWGATLR